jgi:hypothetical protein
MKNEFIPYELAVKLKELGFDEPCLRVGNPNGHTMWKWIEVDKDNETISVNDILNVEYMEVYIQIPTFSQSFRWFRGKYKIRFIIQSSMSDLGEYFKVIFPNGEQRNVSYNTYEEAELACLNKLIEIVKTNKL